VKIFVIVHHTGNSAQMSFSSTHTKFPYLGCTNVFLTTANEHYAMSMHIYTPKVARVIETPGNPAPS
jgi:hypothetical protein